MSTCNILKIGTYDERYKAMSKHGLATITNQDHMPAFSTLRDVYEEGKQNDLVEGGEDDVDPDDNNEETDVFKL